MLDRTRRAASRPTGAAGRRGAAVACLLVAALLSCLGARAQNCSTLLGATQCASAGPGICTFDAAVAVCFATAPNCATLSTGQCALKSNCVVSGSMCVAGLGACSANLAGACRQSCYWDAFAPLGVVRNNVASTPNTAFGAYVGQCVVSMAEITDAIANAVAGVASAATTGDYSCAHWTPHPVAFDGLDACFKHGCARALSQACTPRLVAPVLGQPCTQLFASNASDAAACSNVPEFCSFGAAGCVNGPPTACEQLFGNQQACATFGAQGTCAFNRATRRCTTPPAACGAISSPAACAARSDCHFASACMPYSSGCTALATASACTDAMCYWDPSAPMPYFYDPAGLASSAAPSADAARASGVGLGQCFNSSVEVSGNASAALLTGTTAAAGTFACSQWSGLPDTLDASDMCRAHGCRRTLGSLECGDFSLANMPPGPLCAQLPVALQSNMTQCFAMNRYCSWNLFALACQNLAPATCEQFTNDAAGCAAFNGTVGVPMSSACGWNTDNSRCFTVPRCSYVTSPSVCVGRIDCSWNGACRSVAAAGQTAVLSGCGATSQSSCGVAGNSCFWDPYLTVPNSDASAAFVLGVVGSTSDSARLVYAGVNSAQTPNGACFNGAAEVASQYACEHWEGYFTGATACRFHGCAVNGSHCTSASVASSDVLAPTYSTTTDVEFSVLGAVTTPDLFTANVVVPLTSLWQPFAPVRYVVAIGAATDANAVPGGFLSPGPCTSVTGGNVSLDTQYNPSTRLDQTTLLRELYAAASTGTFAGPGGQPESASLAAVIGSWSVGPAGLVRAVSMTTFDGGSGLVDALSFAIAAPAGCLTQTAQLDPASGAVLGLVVAVPVSVMQLAGGDIITSVAQFRTEFQTHGTVSIADTTNAALSVSMTSSQDATFVYGADGTTRQSCASGYKARHWTMREVFANYDSSMLTGVRAATDVAMTGANCYGSAVVLVAVPVCTTYPLRLECATDIVFQTLCTNVTASGQTFSDCPVPGPVQGDQSFTSRAYTWAAGTDSGQGRPVHVGADGGAALDAITVAINFPTFLDVQSSYTLTAEIGLLTSVGATNMSDPTQYHSSSVNSAKAPAAVSSDDFTPVASLTDALGRSSFTMSLDTSSIVITPLSQAADNTLHAASPVRLNWTQIATKVTRTTRGSPGTILNAAQAHLYVDGFSIRVSTLLQLMPANGYQIDMGWNASPTVTSAVSATRRLLGFGDELPPDQQGTTSLVFLVDNERDDAPPLPPPPPAAATYVAQAECVPYVAHVLNGTRSSSGWAFGAALFATSVCFAASARVTAWAHKRVD